jgi:hypothetical protein
MAGFSLLGTAVTPKIGGEAVLSWPEDGFPMFEVEVANTTGLLLEDSVLLARGVFSEIGDLQPDDTASAILTPPINQAPTFIPVGFGAYHSHVGVDYTTFTQITGRQPQSYYGGRTFSGDELDHVRRAMLLEAMIQDLDWSGGRGDDVYLLGWNRAESPLAVDLGGAAMTTINTTLYIYKLPVRVEEPEHAITITPGWQTWTLGPATTLVNAEPYSFSIPATSDQVIFRYVPLPAARLEEVESLTLSVERGTSTDSTIYLLDWEAGVWEAVKMERVIGEQGRSDVATQYHEAVIADAGRFVGPENIVEVKVQTNQVSNYATHYFLEVTLHGGR